jgi:hypothetical protein
MKICIISDSHDRAEPLSVAIENAQAAEAQAVIYYGRGITCNRGL